MKSILVLCLVTSVFGIPSLLVESPVDFLQEPDESEREIMRRPRDVAEYTVDPTPKPPGASNKKGGEEYHQSYALQGSSGRSTEGVSQTPQSYSKTDNYSPNLNPPPHSYGRAVEYLQYYNTPHTGDMRQNYIPSSPRSVENSGYATNSHGSHFNNFGASHGIKLPNYGSYGQQEHMISNYYPSMGRSADVNMLQPSMYLDPYRPQTPYGSRAATLGLPGQAVSVKKDIYPVPQMKPSCPVIHQPIIKNPYPYIADTPGYIGRSAEQSVGLPRYYQPIYASNPYDSPAYIASAIEPALYM